MCAQTAAHDGADPPRLCPMNSGTGILPVCKSENDGLEARPTKNEGHSFDSSDRT